MKKNDKKNVPLVADKGTDYIWAVLSILALPITAMSLSGLGWHPILAFLIGCGATFGILITEAFTRGKVWIFADKYREILWHKDTAMRILMVTGGILLVLQTILIVEAVRNPNLDNLMLNVIVNKQCQNPQGTLADTLCPIFSIPQINKDYFLFRLALEKASEEKLMNNVLGTCLVLPFDPQAPQSQTATVRFLSACKDLASGSLTTHLIKADVSKREDGSYAVISWLTEDPSQALAEMLNDDSFKERIHDLLNRREDTIIRFYSN